MNKKSSLKWKLLPIFMCLAIIPIVLTISKVADGFNPTERPWYKNAIFHFGEMASKSQTSASLVEGIMGNSKSSVRMANEGHLAVNLAVKSIQDIRVSVTDVSNVVKNLFDASKEIDTIASQTNLLALNAAINQRY